MSKKLLLSMICIIVLFAGCESLDRVVTDDRVVTEDKTNITVVQKVVEKPQAIVAEETEDIYEIPQQDKITENIDIFSIITHKLHRFFLGLYID